MYELDAPVELPLEPVAPPDGLSLADCRQPVSLTWPLWVSEREPLDDVCPPCPLPCPLPLDPLPVVGCCAQTPTASATLSIVPKMNCRFMPASMWSVGAASKDGPAMLTFTVVGAASDAAASWWALTMPMWRCARNTAESRRLQAVDVLRKSQNRNRPYAIHTFSGKERYVGTAIVSTVS
jgi:hypothetical protein